jgi:hypothetical protein
VLTLEPDRYSPQTPGTSINWTAIAGGGVPPYQFQWLLNSGGADTVLQDWSTGNTFAWMPTTANGAYQFKVRVRSTNNPSTTGERVFFYSYPVLSLWVVSVGLTVDKLSPQAPGTTINFTATPGGGTAPYSYQWWLYNGTTSTLLVDWNASNTLAWTPTVANANYSISVNARSAGNTATFGERGNGRSFAILNAWATGLLLVPDRPYPQTPGTTINFTATPAGGAAPYQYQWWSWDGIESTLLSDWSTSNTLAWTPATRPIAESANYSVSVYVRSAGNPGSPGSTLGYEKASGSFFPIVSSWVSTVTLSPDRSAPQASGTTITWTATPTGGTAPYQYKWWIWDGSSWSVGQDWNTSNTFAWTPTTANATYYWIEADIRSAGNTIFTEAWRQMQFPVVANLVSNTRFFLWADKPSLQTPGTTVNFVATHGFAGFTGEYQWWLWDGTTTTLLRDWGASNTFAWTPTTSNGAYSISVDFRQTGMTSVSATRSVWMPILPTWVNWVSVFTDKPSSLQAPGTPITLTALPSGGSAPYQYQWWLCPSGASCVLLRDWGSSNTFTWIPSSTGSYSVSVNVKSSTNTSNNSESRSGWYFTILNSWVTSASLTADKAYPQAPGTTINFTAFASGGMAPYQYQWWLYPGSGPSTLLQDWGASSTFAWTPTVANGNYDIVVNVRSAGDTSSSEAGSGYFFPILGGGGITTLILTPDKTAVQMPNTTVNWTATATGGTTPYQFKWWQCTSSGPCTVLRDWATSNTLAWTPTATGNYTIYAFARSADNNGFYQEQYRYVQFSITATGTLPILTDAVALPPGMVAQSGFEGPPTGAPAPDSSGPPQLPMLPPAGPPPAPRQSGDDRR